ncbi:unnamed protein product [Ectocarpus sp. 8 AP-2014]
MTFIIHSSLRYTHGMRSATPPCLCNHGVKRVPCYLRRHASKTCDSPKRKSKQRDLQQQATLPRPRGVPTRHTSDKNLTVYMLQPGLRSVNHTNYPSAERSG